MGALAPCWNKKIRRHSMRYVRLMGAALPVLASSAVLAQPAAMPVTGQPAADVLASEDLWGNPTFIGGITNKGPDSGSVW